MCTICTLFKHDYDVTSMDMDGDQFEPKWLSSDGSELDLFPNFINCIILYNEATNMCSQPKMKLYLITSRVVY